MFVLVQICMRPQLEHKVPCVDCITQANELIVLFVGSLLDVEQDTKRLTEEKNDRYTMTQFLDIRSFGAVRQRII